MAAETEADRLAFFNADDFGAVFIVGANSVAGVLDDQYLDQLDTTGTTPVFTCRSSDVNAAGIARGTSGTINGVTYVVRNIKPDGTGMSDLILEDQT